MSHDCSAPEIWMKLGGFMHQDYSDCYPDFWSGIDEFWQSISCTEQKELIDFLKYLNKSSLPGGMHKKYWNSSGAQIIPSKIKLFLNELLEKFESMKLVKSEKHITSVGYIAEASLRPQLQVLYVAEPLNETLRCWL